MLTSDQRKIIAATAIIILITTISKRSINRTIWVNPWLLKFGTESSGLWYEKVFDEWKKTDKERYRRTLRLTPSIFNELLAMVEPLIRKQNTKLRQSIPPEKRLAITLKYLASGETFYSLSSQFCVGASTIGDIVPETCKAIAVALKDFMKVPAEADEWRKIADDFYIKWDYPNCVGALDGKHVLVSPPPNSGTKFFNYQKTYSTILLALVDAHYRFTFVDIGSEGSVGDASIWNKSKLKANINSGGIGFPDPCVLPRSSGSSDAAKECLFTLSPIVLSS
ncbi:Protein ANTAGONIST OF LIKE HETEROCHROMATIN PROTEIN 1 [Pseudolycoriella hygida]|uniref:Protein ANTAGONIST OF LIKE HETEROCHROMATIN PROTEIN 1 n=1 Tax=Pseudolycoriella hygida TaxID=35572 RepID=A0A9Q0MYK9_9DIPT|nr:Protein ANTAGONIST OF LIKE HETEROCHROMATIN PROTEIN 1 [Pseudolycoriella hygida]